MNKIKQPQNVKIGPFTYRLRWYDKHEESRDGRYGYADHDRQEIGISDSALPQRKAEVFIHEVIHALWHIFGMEEAALEEEVATKYGMGLSLFARDNPEVMKWWQSLLR